MTARALSDFFSILNPTERNAARARTRVVRVRKGQLVLSRGMPSTDVFFVEEGRLEVVLYATDGQEVSLRDLQAGEMFGELAALDGAGRSASIIAQSDAVVRAMSRADFQNLVGSSSAIAVWLNRYLAAQVRLLTERIFELSALSVQGRLHCELLRLARSAGGAAPVVIHPAPTHAALANRIGTQREVVSREMVQLEARGVLLGGRRRMEFLDLAQLEASVQRLAGDVARVDPQP